MNACIKALYLWDHIIKMKLIVNIRMAIFKNSIQFTSDLKIREVMDTNETDKTCFTLKFKNTVASLDELINKCLLILIHYIHVTNIGTHAL